MSTLAEHLQTLVRRREQIQPGENVFLLWDDRQFRTDALLLCTTHLDELVALAAALQGRGTQEGEPSDAWADLWYFVMDEAPMEFERIVTTYSPKVWHQEAHKLMRAKYPSRVSVEIREAM